jgi:hypothetical protein
MLTFWKISFSDIRYHSAFGVEDLQDAMSAFGLYLHLNLVHEWIWIAVKTLLFQRFLIIFDGGSAAS